MNVMSSARTDAVGASAGVHRRAAKAGSAVDVAPEAIGDSNLRLAFWSIGAGLILGSILGLWSFGGPIPAPPGFEDYAGTARRLVRLAHIAMIALPVLNIVSVLCLRARPNALRRPGRTLAALRLGTVLLPALLLVTAIVPTALYFLPVPVLAITGSMLAIAVGLSSRREVV